MTPTPIAYDFFIDLMSRSTPVVIPANIMIIMIVISCFALPSIVINVCDGIASWIDYRRMTKDRERELQELKRLQDELEEQLKKEVNDICETP